MMDLRWKKILHNLQMEKLNLIEDELEKVDDNDLFDLDEDVA